MPFRDSTFSVIFSEGLLEHFRSPVSIVTEAVRVLQKRGVAIFAVPNKFSFHTLGRSVATKVLKLRWIYGYETSYSKWELRYLLNSIGLKNIEIHGIGLLYGVGRYMPLEMRPLFHGLYIRIRGSQLGEFLTEHFGFQITARAEKATSMS
jgi:SAM-dependent methyltransferase